MSFCQLSTGRNNILCREKVARENEKLRAETYAIIGREGVDDQQLEEQLTKAARWVDGPDLPNKNKTTNVLRGARRTTPSDLQNLDGYIHSINDDGSPVKDAFKKATETIQFRKRFGHFKAVDENEKPILFSAPTATRPCREKTISLRFVWYYSPVILSSILSGGRMLLTTTRPHWIPQSRCAQMERTTKPSALWCKC